MSAKAPEVRVNQAVMLLVGALFLLVVVAPEPTRFYWTPLTLGLAYLSAAIVGGPNGGHWATACALTGWGAAVVLVGATRPDVDISGLYLAGAGLGVVAGLQLQRAGFTVSPMGLALTVTGGGVVLALTTQAVGVLDDARTYAAAITAVAVVNLGLAAREALATRAHRDGRPMSQEAAVTPPLAATRNGYERREGSAHERYGIER